MTNLASYMAQAAFTPVVHAEYQIDFKRPKSASVLKFRFVLRFEVILNMNKQTNESNENVTFYVADVTRRATGTVQTFYNG